MYYSEYGRDQIERFAGQLAGAPGDCCAWGIFDNTAAGAALGNALALARPHGADRSRAGLRKAVPPSDCAKLFAFGKRSATFGVVLSNNSLQYRDWRTIMQTTEKDPAFIAQQVKFIRKMFRLTQENLADAAGLTTRTIEKVESGHHCPEEQTLRSIARAVAPSTGRAARSWAGPAASTR